MMSEAVAGAVKVRLGDVICQGIDKTGPADGEVFTYVDISSIDRDSKKITDAKEISAGDAPSRAKQRLTAGDVIVSMTRPNLNAVAMVPPRLDQAIGSTGFHILRTKHVDTKYIFNLVQTSEFIDSLCQCVQGALYPAVRPADIESFEFLLPPAAEQQRIVAKLEELFSELDKGVENLRTAQQQLKVYRQTLLKHAFEGKLTAEWRALNPDKLESAEALLARIQQEREARYQQQLAEWQAAQQAWEASGKTGSKPAKPKVPTALVPLTADELAELPELPAGWFWVQLEALITGIDQGWSPKCENQPTEDESWGVIKTTAIQHGQFFENHNKSLPKNLAPRAQHKLSAGDILITRAGPRVRVGVCCLIRKVSKNLMNCDKAYRIRSLDSVCAPSYLEGVLNSPKILDTLEHIKSGINDSGVNLNQGAFLRLAIPLCSLSEQTALLIELEEKLSSLDQLENTIATSLQQAEALRQSILKKAFSGQLVPQNPDDEPASMLLERIRAERAAQDPTAKRGRKVAKPA